MISTICAKGRTCEGRQGQGLRRSSPWDNIHLGDIGGNELGNPLKCSNKVQAKEKNWTRSAFL
jgi:hypothetical protein